MVIRTPRALVALALGVLPLASFPLAVSAQTSTFYAPPKILKFGAHSSPIAGKGAVTLKVFVKKNGQVGSVQLLKSTNHADDAAAKEIAQNSTYKPGARDAKPIDAFYTLDLKFSGTSFQSNAGSSSRGGTSQAMAQIQAGKYADAKTTLQAYLAGHPNDASAQTLVGVADSYLNDTAGAVAAFDAAGTITPNYKGLAAKTYSDAAVDALKAKNEQQAVAYAQKSVALQPNTNALYVEGIAYMNAQQYDKSAAALEQAKSLAQTGGKTDPKTMDAIDTELAQVYLLGGQAQKGLALAQDVKRRDPSNTHVDDAIASYYNSQARDLAKAGKNADAVAQYEAGAKAVPASAGILYVNAANVLAQGAKSKDDWTKVKAEADKALAVTPNNANALFLDGVALGNTGDLAGAKAALTKAKANVGTDAALSAQIDAQLANLAKLGQK